MGDKTVFRLWAPTAEVAQVKLYHSPWDPKPYRTLNMTIPTNGVWKLTVHKDLKGDFYTLQVRRGREWLDETAGIAAKAVGVNGTHGAIIDWNDTDPEIQGYL